MSVYKFKCGECSEKFDVKMTLEEKESGKKEVACPKCKSKNVKEAFSLKNLLGGGGDDCHCCCGGGDCK